ncbi:MAG: hypothetical protein AAF222_09185 [Pseudomonadota bacterium]
MAEKFLVKETAERLVHNELSNAAYWFLKVAKEKIEAGERQGVAIEMIAGLIFCEFSVEAKLNFVGWKYFEDGWPERASFREKTMLLNKALDLNLSWGERPLQTLKDLMRFRNALAHGQPEVVDIERVVDVEPEIWDILKSDWEQSVNVEFLERCREDEGVFWEALLKSAGISKSNTLTSGHQSITVLREEAEKNF